MVTFLPPASRIPEAKIAPILLTVSSCLSRIIFSNCRLNVPTRESLASLI
uniref:Uncharacterized protein n=1 Tax=Lotus japonicus TaxID=34305 RepID=I3T1S9_LOTJA|nr:unknown [Lotus japonicus]